MIFRKRKKTDEEKRLDAMVDFIADAYKKDMKCAICGKPLRSDLPLYEWEYYKLDRYWDNKSQEEKYRYVHHNCHIKDSKKIE